MSEFRRKSAQRVASRFLLRDGGESPGPLSEGLLQGLLGLCHALYWHHWTTHWQTKGDPFYGDHLLFERLYSGMVSEIDTVAEKLVQMHGSQAVAVELIHPVTGAWLSRWLPETDLVGRSLRAERDFQQAIRSVYDDLKESGELSLGLDDFLMSTANAHETNLYLLQQRMGGIMRIASNAAPRGYKHVRDDQKGFPVFFRGEQGRPGTRMVARWGMDWAVYEWASDGWHRLDDPFRRPQTPQEAADAGDDRSWKIASLSGDGTPDLSAEGHFFDKPRAREVREFAQSKALSNDIGVAAQAVRSNETTQSIRQVRREVNESPPTVPEILQLPGGEDFATLNRYVVQTEVPTDPEVPQGHDEIPKHPHLLAR